MSAAVPRTALLLAIPTALSLVPYTDPEGAFRVLRPAGWKVERVQVGLRETVFYRDDPRRGPRVVVIPEAPVAASTLREATCLLLQYVRPANPSAPPRPGPWPERTCPFPWSFRAGSRISGEGAATWRASTVRERALFRIRPLGELRAGGLEVTFLAVVSPAGEFASFERVFRRILESYRAP